MRSGAWLAESAGDRTTEEVEAEVGRLAATPHTAPELLLPGGRRRRRGDEWGDVYGLATTLRDICAAAAPRYVKPSAAAAAAATGSDAEADAAAAVLLPAAAAGRGRVAAARLGSLAAALRRGWATDPMVRPAAATLLDALEPDAASAACDSAALDGCFAAICRLV